MRTALQIFNLFLFLVVAQSVTAGASQILREGVIIPDPSRPGIQIKVVYPEPLSLSEFQPRVLMAFKIAEEKLQIQFKDSFEIFFDPGPDVHNGLTTVIPRNRVYVHLEPPEIDESTGMYRDYLLETTTHELAHLAVMQQRSGAFGLLDFLVGNSSRPLGLWPRWMHEGLAVWVEGHWGGRPQSGIIDFDNRKMGHYFAQNQSLPVNSTLLDGQKELKTLDAGDLPYHLGTQLFEQIAKKLGPRLGDFIRESGKNLGLSYRVILRESYGVDVDAEWNLLLEKIKISTAQPRATQNQKTLAKSKKFSGPIRYHQSGVPQISWIEFDSGKSPYPQGVVWTSPEKAFEYFSWTRGFSSPRSIFKVSDDKILVHLRQNKDLFKSTQIDPRSEVVKGLLVFNPKTQSAVCTFDLENQPREVTVYNNFLSIVFHDQKFIPHVQSLEVNFENCDIETTKLIYSGTRPFQRVSSLTYSANRLYFSVQVASDKPGIYRETLVSLPHKSGLIDATLSARRVSPTESTFYFPDEIKGENELLVTTTHRNYLGPQKIIVGGGKATLFRPELSTGASKSVLSLNPGKVFAKIGSFEAESLVELSVADFELSSQIVPLETYPTEPTVFASQDFSSPNSTEYSRLGTLFPQFWIPTLLATSGGFVFLGEAFYEDITKDLEGYTGLGWETFSNRPYFRTQLQQNKLSWGPFHTLTGSLGYSSATAVDPITRELLVQNRFGGIVATTTSFVFSSSGMRSDLSMGFGYSQASDEGLLAGFRYFYPTISLNFTSRWGLRNRGAFFDLVGAKSGWAFDQSLKFFSGHDYVANLQGQTPLWGRWAIHGQIEYGSTDIQNYPATFFEVGGLSTFNFFTPSFSTRGFDYRSLLAREVVRFGSEIGFPIYSDPIFDLPWNRLAIDRISGRLVAESLTYSSYRTARMGNRYLTSLGGIADVWGSAIHYVDYRLSTGIFRGLGEFGEWKFFIVFSSGLNI